MTLLKKTSLFLLTIIFSLIIFSCKKEVKKEPAQFSIEQKTITVKWTGYKTTDKVAVNGQFKEINITNGKSSATAIEALNGVKFSIPISSLFSNDNLRDNNLKQLFFGVMDATLSLTGTLNLNDDGTGNIDLLMNGVQQKIPVTYIASGQLIEINGTMNLDDWHTQSALASLNKVCFGLHKGADGISKTWNEVSISAAIYLSKK